MVAFHCPSALFSSIIFFVYIPLRRHPEEEARCLVEIVVCVLLQLPNAHSSLSEIFPFVQRTEQPRRRRMPGNKEKVC